MGENIGCPRTNPSPRRCSGVKRARRSTSFRANRESIVRQQWSPYRFVRIDNAWGAASRRDGRSSWVTVVGRRDWTITSLNPVEQNGHKLWRFEFTSDTDQYSQPLPYSGCVDLDPEENWSVHSLQVRETIEGGAQEIRARTTRYGPKLGGVSCLRELHNEWTKPSGEVVRRATKRELFPAASTRLPDAVTAREGLASLPQTTA
jgi:hypothetical protein